MKKISKIFLIFAVMAFVGFVITKSLLGSWMPFYSILIGFGLGFSGIAAFIERKNLADFFTMKTTKHGMNMGAMVALVILLVVLTNYIAVKRNKTWDFSQTQTNTLSDQSIKIVKDLKSELKILFFYKDGTQGVEENRKAFRDLIKKYQDQSNLVDLEFIELNQNPQKAEEYGVTKGSGLAFVEYGTKRNRIEKVDEQEITQAIIKVTREKMKNVYFITGHGEANIEDSQEASGLNAFKLLIENNSFNVKTLNLPTEPQIPDDADTVLIVRPMRSFTNYELNEVEKYLKKGGNLLLALEPNKTVGLESLLAKLGIYAENNFVKSSFRGIGFIEGGTIGNLFSASSPVTKVFQNQADIVRMDWPMSFKKANVPEGIQVETLVGADENAVAFRLPDTNSPVLTKGPYDFALEVSGLFPGADQPFQLLVFGDAEFLTNHMLYQSLNRDLALNSTSFLTEEEGLISITPREVKRTEIMVTTAKQGTFYLFLFAVPLILLIISITFWYQRRGHAKS